jgi:hypothetical protein
VGRAWDASGTEMNNDFISKEILNSVHDGTSYLPVVACLGGRPRAKSRLGRAAIDPSLELILQGTSPCQTSQTAENEFKGKAV